MDKVEWSGMEQSEDVVSQSGRIWRTFKSHGRAGILCWSLGGQRLPRKKKKSADGRKPATESAGLRIRRPGQGATS